VRASSAQRLPRALQCLDEGTSLRACQTQTVSADDTVVGYSEQTPMEAPLGKPEGVFHDSIPGISNPLLEPEEDKKLLEALPNWLRLMTILALQTAARRGEIVNLKWEAVHPENIEL
jgi:integrase